MSYIERLRQSHAGTGVAAMSLPGQYPAVNEAAVPQRRMAAICGGAAVARALQGCWSSATLRPRRSIDTRYAYRKGAGRMTVKFGVFVPQGWKMDLVGIDDPAEQYETMTRVARRA